MPRNSTGNYTLPLPPVVSGEVIESAWANTSLDDIGQALTESLDRYGRGGMLAPFLFTDGTVTAPGAAWANAPGTGFWRDSSALHFSWNTAEVFYYNQNGISLAVGKTFFLNGPLGLAAPEASIDFKFDDAEAGTAAIQTVTPDGLGRAAIDFVHSTSGAGSDSAIEFFTNWYGNSRDRRVRIDPNGLTHFYAGARTAYGSAFGWQNAGGDDAWRIDIDGANNFYVYNVGQSKSQLSLNASGSSFFGGVCGATSFQTNGDWSGIQFYDTSGTKTAELFGRPDGGVTIYGWDSAASDKGTLDILANQIRWSDDIEVDGYVAVKGRMTNGWFISLASSTDLDGGNPTMRLYGAADWKFQCGNNGDVYISRNGVNSMRMGSNDVQITKTLFVDAPCTLGGLSGDGQEHAISIAGNGGEPGPYMFLTTDGNAVGVYWNASAGGGMVWGYTRSNATWTTNAANGIRATRFTATPYP